MIGSNIVVDGSGDDGLDIDVVASGAIFNFNNVNLINSGDEGLNVVLGDGSFTFSNLDISGSAEDGIQILGSDGTFMFDSASSVAGRAAKMHFILKACHPTSILQARSTIRALGRQSN